jgi:site-specific DNA-methyltransferase (adenine-specific)
MLDLNKVYLGDCLDIMKDIDDKSIDAIICDLPYGTTTCSWDTVIPFEPLWEQYNRVIKDNGAIVLFSQQPFTSALIMSNPTMFKYMWYWKKSRPSGYVNAKLKPLKDIEEIVVFSKGTTANGSKSNMVYNPQGLVEVNKKWKRPKNYEGNGDVNHTRKATPLEREIKYENYPRQVLEYSNSNHGLIHPTQKPVDLVEFLIRTYTNEGELILDNCGGSGTTAVAAINTNRNYILIEKEEQYYTKSKDRLEKKGD